MSRLVVVCSGDAVCACAALGAVVVSLFAGGAAAQPAPEPMPEPVVSPQIEIHGFVSEGAFVETANDYFGSTSQASLEMFEVGLNASTDVADRLRAGLQLFARDIGSLRDASPRVDWAFLDYRWRRWLGLRAGIIKLPFGLYNEYVDVDAARLPILLPSSVYPIRDRDVLISHTGFALYGSMPLGGAGDVDYQAWLGTLAVPRTALDLSGATLDSVNTKYVTGGQVFWRPPVDGLRIGATYLRTSIDFHITLDAHNIAALIMAGVVPANYDGKLLIAQRPTSLVIGSAEYIRGNWLFAAEYSRWLIRQRTSLPVVLPTFTRDAEKLYAMASYRVAPAVEVGAYYSLDNADVSDVPQKYTQPSNGFQRDLAATVRFDINDHWLWKLEAHYMDGSAALAAEFNAHPDARWGLFLIRTTVTF